MNVEKSNHLGRCMKYVGYFFSSRSAYRLRHKFLLSVCPKGSSVQHVNFLCRGCVDALCVVITQI